MIDSKKDFNCYYYNINLHWEKDTDNYIFEISNKLNNKQWYEIEKINDTNFFVRLLKNYDMDIYPKKWKRNSDVRSLKNLDIEDDEVLYFDTYILISFDNLDIFMNSIWIISVLKSWREIWNLILKTFVKELFNIKNQAFDIKTIPYKNSKEYIEKVNKITRFSFWVAGVNFQKQIWLKEEDWLNAIFKIKDEIWWENLSFSVWDVNWLKKKSILDFYNKRSHSFKGTTYITIEDAWKHVQQKIDEIRFKSILSLVIENNWLLYDDVKYNMIEDFWITIDNIKKEYNIN